jgi:hypothetical protein
MCKAKKPKAPPAAGTVGAEQELKAADTSGLFAARAARAQGVAAPNIGGLSSTYQGPVGIKKRKAGTALAPPPAAVGRAQPGAQGSTVLGA